MTIQDHSRRMVKPLRKYVSFVLIFDLLVFVAMLGCGSRSRTKSSAATVPHVVSLRWNRSTSKVIGYNVYRRITVGGEYTKLNPSLVKETSYADVTVQPGRTYSYAVSAVSFNNSESALSTSVSATIPGALKH